MPDNADAPGAGGLEAASSRSDPILFSDLDAPRPAAAAPPQGARWLAFASILVAGLLSGMIGYGTGDLLGDGSSLWTGVGAVAGAAAGAVGVGIVAGLTLRAMSEWRAIEHPEAAAPPPDARRQEADDT
jgi:hypothetical protein